MQEMLQNYIHLKNTEPTERISCILSLLLLADHRSTRMTITECSHNPLNTIFYKIKDQTASLSITGDCVRNNLFKMI